jgi:hypothetical protein
MVKFYLIDSVGKVIECMLEDKSPIGINAVQIETKIICRYLYKMHLMFHS